MTRSKLVVWSFVLVLIAWLFLIVNFLIPLSSEFSDGVTLFLAIIFWLAGLISIVTSVLGIVALRKIRKKKLKGKGLAIATIILSAIVIIFFVYLLIIFYLFVKSMTEFDLIISLL